jgi:hypothetical protein
MAEAFLDEAPAQRIDRRPVVARLGSAARDLKRLAFDHGGSDTSRSTTADLTAR